uniref:Protein kinase domain-containing protein n=1 Tax=Takifugu rubripes TaxID=31033 RepID=A0A674P343_TAKRU
MLSVQQEHATGLDLFMDLIKNMLQVDPNQRITPVEALQHPFFNVKEEATSKKPCLENIKLTNYAVDHTMAICTTGHEKSSFTEVLSCHGNGQSAG